MVQASACFRRWFVLRLAGIYGPGRHVLLDQLRAGATELPGTGTHRLNLVHRDDIVAAVLACATAPDSVRNAIFNVAGDTAAPKSEVTAWLAKQLGRVPPTFAQDGRLPPGVPRRRGKSGPVPDRLISNARLKQTLGWRPQFPDFRDGYRQIFAAESGM
jgi:nucleoside-diphosphate-sugar epimerase